MRRVRDWIEWFTGYDGTAKRFFLAVVAANALLFGIVGYDAMTSDNGERYENPCQPGHVEILNKDRTALICVTEAERDRRLDVEVDEMLRDLIAEETPPAAGTGAN